MKKIGILFGAVLFSVFLSSIVQVNAAENEPHEGLVENITEEEFKTLQEEGVLDNTFTYDEYKDLYLEHDDQFICPNGRKVVFKTYKNKKNAA